MDIKQLKTPQTTEEKLSYSMGLNIAQGLLRDGFENIDLDTFQQAIKDIFQKRKPLVGEQEAAFLLQNHMQEVIEEKAKKNLEEGRAFLKNNKNKKGMVTKPSGLQYKIERAGSGTQPTLMDTVVLHYQASLLDGTVFESSYANQQPVQTQLKNTMPAMQEAISSMKVGAKWRLFVPSKLAYGDKGRPPMVMPYATLIYDIELLHVQKGK